jgi:hypothetical protein
VAAEEVVEAQAEQNKPLVELAAVALGGVQMRMTQRLEQ